MLDLSGPVGAFISAGVVSAAGTAWFVYVMKGLKTAPRPVRLGVYAAVFAAYFILTLILIDQTRP